MNKTMIIRFRKTLFVTFLIIVGLIAIPSLANPDHDPPDLWLQDQESNTSQMDAVALSDQQIAEDLARIQAAFEEDEVLEEFIPEESLSADIAVNFPSDI